MVAKNNHYKHWAKYVVDRLVAHLEPNSYG